MTSGPRDPREVEFVVGPGDGAPVDEEPAGARPRMFGRAGRPLAALAVAAVLAVVIVRVMAGGSTSPSAHESHPAPGRGSSGARIVRSTSPAATAQPGVAGSVGTLGASDAGTVRIPPAPPGPVCGTDVLCRTTTTVPAQVLLALRAAYPRITVDGVITQLTGPSAAGLRLRTREIRAHTPLRAIVVSVHPAAARDRTQVELRNAGTELETAATSTTRPWTVTVTVHPVSSRHTDDTVALELAADPRLLLNA